MKKCLFLRVSAIVLAAVFTTGCAGLMTQDPAPVEWASGKRDPQYTNEQARQQARNLEMTGAAVDDTGVQPIRHGISVSLSAQRLCWYEDFQPVQCDHVTSGKPSHPTPTGSFRVLKKDARHVSATYPRPRGGAQMPNALNFYEHYWIHAGDMPGYPASSGCVRVHLPSSEWYFRRAKVGTPVVVLN